MRVARFDEQVALVFRDQRRIVVRSRARIDQRPQQPHEGGLRASLFAGDHEDGELSGRAQRGEEPRHQGYEPVLAVVIPHVDERPEVADGSAGDRVGEIRRARRAIEPEGGVVGLAMVSNPPRVTRRMRPADRS